MKKEEKTLSAFLSKFISPSHYFELSSRCCVDDQSFGFSFACVARITFNFIDLNYPTPDRLIDLSTSTAKITSNAAVCFINTSRADKSNYEQAA